METRFQMAEQNGNEDGRAVQVQREIPAFLREIVERSKLQVKQTASTLRGLADSLDRAVQFQSESDNGAMMRGYALDIQALGTRALWTAALTISMSDRVNVCAQTLEAMNQ